MVYKHFISYFPNLSYSRVITFFLNAYIFVFVLFIYHHHCHYRVRCYYGALYYRFFAFKGCFFPFSNWNIYIKDCMER